MNTNLVLIAGKSSCGKSASLLNLKDPQGVFYANCENNKKLPFKSDFVELNITDALQINEVMTKAETEADVHTVVVDSLTYMMALYESIHVLPSSNTMKALTYSAA